MGTSRWQGWREGLDPQGLCGLNLEVGLYSGALEEWGARPCPGWNMSRSWGGSCSGHSDKKGWSRGRQAEERRGPG